MHLSHLFQLESTAIILVLGFGIYHRRNKKRHVQLMVTGIIWDLLLVVQVEVAREVVVVATKVGSNTLATNIHIGIAIATVVFYVLVILSGKSLYQGNLSLRNRHKFLGWTTFLLRILTFATSFTATSPI